MLPPYTITTLPINVGLGRRAGVGKDTLGALIVERNKHYRRALADAVKEEIGCLMLGHTPNERTRLIAWQWVESQKHKPEMRLLLQAFADGKRELVSRRYWIDNVLGFMEMFRAGEMMVAAPEHAGIVVTDVRHRNEVAEFLGRDFLLIDIFRPDTPALPHGMSSHRSETQLGPHDLPYCLVNDGTPEEMLELYDTIVATRQVHGIPRKEDWPVIFGRTPESVAKALAEPVVALANPY